MRKKFCSLILALSMILSFVPVVNVSAATKSGTCGDSATWTLDNNGVLTISGTGAMRDYTFTTDSPGSTAPWNSSMSSITSVVIQEGITNIGAYSFNRCSLRDVTISDSVTKIGKNAFASCERMTSVTLPQNLTEICEGAFSGCTWLADVIIPDNVTSIGVSAFSGCESIKNITIPSKVTKIEAYSFYNCYSLNITLPDSITSLNYDAFNYCNTNIYYNGTESQWNQVDKTGIRRNNILSIAFLKNIISYNANGGTNAPEAQVKTHGETLKLSDNIPERQGYAFMGWATSDNTNIVAYSSGADYLTDEDVVLYAVWKEEYTISYNANGGSNAPDSQIKLNGNDLTISDIIPTRNGYDFLGWSETQNATTADYQAGGTYTKEGNTVLYAVWQPHTYTITYNANGGSGAPNSQIKTHDISLTLSNTQPTRNGYSFVGWAESSTATNIDYTAGAEYTKEGNAILYAVWREIYTVNYDANGGSGAPESQIKTKNVTLILSSTEPTREGYKFEGWATEKNVKRVDYLPGATYTEEYGTTLYAVWIAETYKVTYNANGGTGAPSEQTKTYDIPLTLSTTVPTRSGYVFMGWAEIPEPDLAVYNAGDEYTDERPLTLYAVWKKTYTIKYDANGGSNAPNNQTKIEGITLTLSTDEPTREGYDFLGWAEDSNANIADYSKGGWYTNNAATTLYAVWDAHKYTVSYDANGGTGAPSAQTKTYGTNLVLSTVIPTKTGYDFVGWASNKNAANKDYSSGGIYTTEDDTTLYAVWELHKYTVAYNLNGGTGTVKSQKKTYGQPLTLSDSIPTREGYIFLGWSEAVDGGTIIYTADDEFNKDYDVTLFAVWQCSEVKSTMASGGYIMNDLNNLSEIYLFSDSKDARIYYTIDGTTPTINSTLFSVEEEPLISADMTLKAIAVRDNCVNSDVSEFVYVRAEKPKLKTLDEYSKSVTINFEQPEGTRAISVQSYSGDTWSDVDSNLIENGKIQAINLTPTMEYRFRIRCEFYNGSLYSDEIYATTTSYISDECEILAVVKPSGAVIDTDTKTITGARVTNRYATTPLEIEVSDGATWELYASSTDARLKRNVIENKTVELSAGETKTVYVRVTAQDEMHSNIYSVQIYRQSKSSPPTLSRTSDIVLRGTKIELTAAGDIIKYTLDNTEPSEFNGILYTEPITVNEDVIIRAAAKEADKDEYSEIITKMYYVDTIVPLDTPSNPEWNGKTATWRQVPDASAYQIQLYKDNEKFGQSVIAESNSYDFTSLMTESGVYTFDVTAVGDNITYVDSDKSTQSDIYNYIKQGDVEPTAEPTATPTATPTVAPTATPTSTPTAKPTASPTATPTVAPTATPTASPTPTVKPTATPTIKPTATPTAKPTVTPTATPTAEPTVDIRLLPNDNVVIVQSNTYEGSAVMLVAIYDTNNRLSSLATVPITLPAGGTYRMTLPEVPDNKKIKIMLWKDLKSMKPLCKYEDVT